MIAERVCICTQLPGTSIIEFLIICDGFMTTFLGRFHWRISKVGIFFWWSVVGMHDCFYMHALFWIRCIIRQWCPFGPLAWDTFRLVVFQKFPRPPSTIHPTTLLCQFFESFPLYSWSFPSDGAGITATNWSAKHRLYRFWLQSHRHAPLTFSFGLQRCALYMPYITNAYLLTH